MSESLHKTGADVVPCTHCGNPRGRVAPLCESSGMCQMCWAWECWTNRADTCTTPYCGHPATGTLRFPTAGPRRACVHCARDLNTHTRTSTYGATFVPDNPCTHCGLTMLYPLSDGMCRICRAI